jgi:hypothetical protein
MFLAIPGNVVLTTEIRQGLKVTYHHITLIGSTLEEILQKQIEMKMEAELI